MHAKTLNALYLDLSYHHLHIHPSFHTNRSPTTFSILDRRGLYQPIKPASEFVSVFIRNFRGNSYHVVAYRKGWCSFQALYRSSKVDRRSSSEQRCNTITFHRLTISVAADTCFWRLYRSAALAITPATTFNSPIASTIRSKECASAGGGRIQRSKALSAINRNS